MKLRIVAFLLLIFLCINVASAAEVAYYKFDGDLTDSAGSNDGSNSGTTNVAYTPGYYNQSGYFDGSAKITVADNSALRLDSGDFTISFWAKLQDRSSSFEGILYKTDWNNGYLLYHDDSDSIMLRIFDSGLYSQCGFSSMPESYYDEWHMYTWVYNSSNSNMEMYVDGFLDNYVTLTNTCGTYTGSLTIADGAKKDTELDEFRIYNQVLSASEVQNLYQNSMHNAFVISAYNEINQTQLNISNFAIYNENQSVSSRTVIDGDYYVYSGQFSEMGQYIASIDVNDYYPRKSIVEYGYVPFIVNTYLIPESETVIYDTFKVIENAPQYNYNDIILRIDKPMPNGTDTVYSSHLDFQGTTATYLLASDNYILYIITPEETINYGWLTPDPDGLVEISLYGITIDSYYDSWYNYNYSVSGGIVNLEYSSTDTITNANFIISNSTAEKYNVIAETDSGSFNYVIKSNETLNVYFELVRVDGAKFSDFWIIPGSEAEKTVFPESYPQWLKNSVVTALAILCILGFSSYRVEVGMALGVGIVSVAYLWGEYEINESTGYTVALLAFIVIIEFVIQQRKEAVR